MVEVVVINSFRNHDRTFYPRRNQKSRPFLSEKITLVPDFYQGFYPLSKGLLLYYLRILLIIIGFLSLIIRYKTRFFDSLNYPGFTNSGEPAGVFSFLVKIKGGFFLLPKSAAAGLLFYNLQLDHRMMLIVGTHLVFVRMKFENTYDIIFLFLLITALKFDRFPNSGEPAAVVDLLSQSLACDSALPKSTAAGLLFSNEPSPHYPNPPTPHFHEPIHTPKTSINISIANYKIRRTPHVRS